MSRKPPASLSKTRVEEAMRAASGIVSDAARSLGVRRTTLYRWLERHKDVQALVGEYREDLVDLAEKRIRKKVDDDDLGAMIWVLKTLGKRRGWIERIPDVIAAANLDALRRIVERLGVEDVTDEQLITVSQEVKAEMEAERA